MSTQLPPPSTGANSTPEAQAALFAADPRIHYSRETGTWRLENEDGSELEYDATKGTWIALVGIFASKRIETKPSGLRWTRIF
jgi:HIV Tat-specific factor 1